MPHPYKRREWVAKKPAKVPPVGSDAWKTFVADAIAKAPARRTEQEQEAIRMAMTEVDAPRCQDGQQSPQEGRG
jgi:hypothetical protein